MVKTLSLYYWDTKLMASWNTEYTQSLKNGLNRRFWKKIVRLRLRHFRFESLLRVYNAIKPVKTFCQVFKVEICKANTTVTWQVVIPQPIPRNICVPRLFYARILLFTAVFGHLFFALKYRESLWEILRDSRFQNSKSVLVRFGAFMTETFERHCSNQNRNTNWNEQKLRANTENHICNRWLYKISGV